jgi:predicted NAD-dependent protein-ADP-ribosyltransferase YbiA (DUF1768 family)
MLGKTLMKVREMINNNQELKIEIIEKKEEKEKIIEKKEIEKKENEIKFYRQNEEYGYFSNFSKHEITIENKKWPTTGKP